MVLADVVVAGGMRDRLRRAILRRVDGAAAPPDPSRWVRATGRMLSKRGALRRRARFGLLDPLGLPARGARCLEIGPGRGYELLNLSRLGWQAVGLEFDPVAAAVAEETSGCEVFGGQLGDAPWPAETFDLIYASHVFEHLLDPLDALSELWTLLRPGGQLVLVYPNPRSLCARAFGSLAVTWDPPRHIFLAPRRAVHDCLTRIGFSGVRVVGLARYAYGYAGWARERRSPMPRVGRWLTPGIARAVEVVGDAVGLDVGEELLVTARRPGLEAT
ncbi:MAG: class I SAM-dependent methyltransferase [Acidimicrobiales bacterium]